MRYNIEDLKKEYIGKTFTWLTIIDVFRNDKNMIMFKCQCKCGIEKCVYMNKVLSGSTKSCGCYHLSEEKSDKYKQWCKNNPDKVKEKSDKYKQWCKNNPDKVKESIQHRINTISENNEIIKNQAIKYKQWREANPDKVKQIIINRKLTLNNNPQIQFTINKKLSEYYKNHKDKVDELIKLTKDRHLNTRLSSNISKLLEIIHPDYINDLLSGNIVSDMIIKTLCPKCNNYAEHTLNNVFRFKSSSFRLGVPPICNKCKNSLTSSKPEQELVDYITSFYSGEYIRNTRDIISPQELDLYYPEKKIAIEFNGDYWHSTEFKEKDYHINKFNLCKDNNILLVSIFESEWNNRKDEIKEYLKDLFNNKENKLSFNEDNSLMNNNYPSPNINIKLSLIQEDYYTFNNKNVFTCGYSIL